MNILLLQPVRASSRWVPHHICGEVTYGTECYECNTEVKDRTVRTLWPWSACRRSLCTECHC